MMAYSKLSKRPSMLRPFTSLKIEEFDRVYKTIESKYEEYENKRRDRPGRKRAIGQARKFRQGLLNRIIMLLVYYQLYISYSLAGFLFDLDQSNVHRNIKHLEPLVKKYIPLPKRVFKKTKEIEDMCELLKYFPDMKAFLDATEQEIPKPKNKRRRRSYYSGKKKRHTVKTQIITNKEGLIIDIIGHEHGSEHDYAIFKKKHPPLPPDVEIDADS